MILPHRNKRDLAELPTAVTAALQFTFVETLIEAFHELFNDAAAAVTAADTRVPVIAAQAATINSSTSVSSSNSSSGAVSSTALCSASQRSNVLYGPVLTSLL